MFFRLFFLWLIFIFHFRSFADDDFFDKKIMSYYIDNGFKTKRLVATYTNSEDIDVLWKYIQNDEKMYYYSKQFVDKQSKEEIIKYLTDCLKAKDNFYFTIKIKENGKLKPIGQVSFKFFSKGVMTISYWIAKKYRRKGYLKEMGYSFIEEVFFKHKDIKYLEVYVDESNVASKGFVKGLFRHLSRKYSCSSTSEISDDIGSENDHIMTRFLLSKNY